MLTKPQKIVLYSLGCCYAQLSQKFADKPMDVSVSKIAFIDALLKQNAIGKQKRALYKNLEALEKKKLIIYNEMQLRFTQRGYNAYLRLNAEVRPYIAQNEFWKSNLKFSKKVQTHLR